MPKKTAPTSSEMFQFLYGWQEAAQDIVNHIGCTRGTLAPYHDEADLPWPIHVEKILSRDTSTAVEYLKNRHALDVRAPLGRIRDAAAVWMTKRDVVTQFGTTSHADGAATHMAMRDLERYSDEGMPTQARLNLDVRIAEGAIWRASFPLLAERFGNERRFLIRGNLIGWAIWVQRAFADVIRDWPLPDESQARSPRIRGDEPRERNMECLERWELAAVISPSYIPSTDETPKKLAIEEARRAGDLVVALPLIKKLDEEMEAFVRQAVGWPHGNLQPFRTERLFRAINELDELVGDEPAASAGDELHHLAGSDERTNMGSTDAEPVVHLKPSQKKAKALYEWAIEHIDGAEKMTYVELFHALVNDPRCAGEGLPKNAAAFARYCRAAGVHRRAAGHAATATPSVRRASAL